MASDRLNNHDGRERSVITVGQRAHQLMRGLMFAAPGQMLTLNRVRAERMASALAQYDLICSAVLGTYRQIAVAAEEENEEAHTEACELLTKHMDTLSRVCGGSTGMDFGSFMPKPPGDERFQQ